jgi:hypothetical protein
MSPRETLATVLRDVPPLGLEVIGVVDTSGGMRQTGLVLAERAGSPGVLGLSMIDGDGISAALGMSEPEVVKLRDALTAWLEAQA